VVLTSADGGRVELRIAGYEFPEDPQGDGNGDWDANWLVVSGAVAAADGRAWEFTDPLLTTWEAVELLEWLRRAVGGHLRSGDGLAFVEPDLELAYRGRVDGRVLLTVTLDEEAGPVGSARPDRGPAAELELAVDVDSLRRATDEWRRELAGTPPR